MIADAPEHQAVGRLLAGHLQRRVGVIIAQTDRIIANHRAEAQTQAAALLLKLRIEVASVLALLQRAAPVVAWAVRKGCSDRLASWRQDTASSSMSCLSLP